MVIGIEIYIVFKIGLEDILYIYMFKNMNIESYLKSVLQGELKP